MKLVELLVESWAKWMPADEAFVHQYDHGMVWSSDGQSWGQADPVEDFETARVTRPQWQAEKDRMSKMEALIEARDNPPSTEPTYEQQLWDRVYFEAWKQILPDLGSLSVEDIHNFVAGSGLMADAFMAERAKRVGK